MFKKGYKMSAEHKEKIRLSHIGKSGNKTSFKKGCEHPNWKGGLKQNKTYIDWQKNNNRRLKFNLNKQGLGHTFGEWELLKKQYNYTCPCCGKGEPEIKLTEDHIIPLIKGGSNLIENIQPLCLKCNMKKYTKIIKYERLGNS
jgi:hypothetical protein